ncbi:hypothetical protein PG985_007059 [Apiospora marii]|uniref:Uncharacterized protein n=1 Tax=Apiospora marii TaxID=335849 RepID=A0ABR1SF84_9PEZI
MKPSSSVLYYYVQWVGIVSQRSRIGQFRRQDPGTARQTGYRMRIEVLLHYFLPDKKLKACSTCVVTGKPARSKLASDLELIEAIAGPVAAGMQARHRSDYGREAGGQTLAMFRGRGPPSQHAAPANDCWAHAGGTSTDSAG